MHKFLIVLAIIILGINLSCDKAPNESNYNVSYIEPGRRDYQWTVDTIGGEFLSLSCIWGDSSDNIWIGGSMGDNGRSLWFYNDSVWKAVGLPNVYQSSIFGFGRNFVLLGDLNKNVWTFNGSNWSKTALPIPDSLRTHCFLDINDFNGMNKDNIWAVGTLGNNNTSAEYGVIYHFDGIKWELKKITNKPNVHFYRIYPADNGEKFFIHVLKRNKITYNDTTAIYVFDGSNLKEIFQSPCTTYESSLISKIGNDLYFTSNRKIYRYLNGNINEYKTIEDYNNGAFISGRSEKDIFLWMWDGLAHFNGNDVQYIFKLKNPIHVIDNVLIFEKEIFFFAKEESTGNFYFAKGELKD